MIKIEYFIKIYGPPELLGNEVEKELVNSAKDCDGNWLSSGIFGDKTGVERDISFLFQTMESRQNFRNSLDVILPNDPKIRISLWQE